MRLLERWVLPAVLALSLSACGEDAPAESQSSAAPKAKAPAKAKTAEPPAAAAAAAEPKDIPKAYDIDEGEFVESDKSRDPFRSFAKVFVDEARGEVKSQREVVLEQYSIDELKLIAIVGGMSPERAMLVDPSGVGHVVIRGQYLGRAQVVQPNGGMGAAYEVNWRVDRIREGDLVLVRDDPSNPEIPSATRVIQLRTDEITLEEEGTEADQVAGELEKLKETIRGMESAEAARRRGAEGASAAPRPSGGPE